jgi:transposase
MMLHRPVALLTPTRPAWRTRDIRRHTLFSLPSKCYWKSSHKRPPGIVVPDGHGPSRQAAGRARGNLPSSATHGAGRPWANPRGVMNAVLWVLRTGAPWAELPRRYPPCRTCHRRARRRDADDRHRTASGPWRRRTVGEGQGLRHPATPSQSSASSASPRTSRPPRRERDRSSDHAASGLCAKRASPASDRARLRMAEDDRVASEGHTSGTTEDDWLLILAAAAFHLKRLPRLLARPT